MDTAGFPATPVVPRPYETAMSDTLESHAKASEYDLQMPTPPRIVIPPLGNWVNANQTFRMPGMISHPDPSMNIDFLNTPDFARSLQIGTQSGNSWRYEHRRQAQPVLPYLWIGPFHAAKDRDFLLRECFTMILAIQHKGAFGASLTMGAMRVADELGISKSTLEVANGPDLIASFPLVTRIINGHLRELHNRAQLNPAGGIPEGKVLVFCESGNEKSAAVVAAYLMDNFQGVDFINACQITNARRFCCCFDDNAKNLLQTYDGIIRARRSVEAASTGVPIPLGSTTTSPFFGAPDMQQPRPQWAASANGQHASSKRGRETEDGNDAMMDAYDDEHGDQDRFLGRAHAPFK